MFEAWTLPDLDLLTDLWSTPSRSCTPILSGFTFHSNVSYYFECCHYQFVFPAPTLHNLWTSSTPMEPWSPQSSMCRCDKHFPTQPNPINIIITISRLKNLDVFICSQELEPLSSLATWTSIQTADHHRLFSKSTSTSYISSLSSPHFKTSKTEFFSKGGCIFGQDALPGGEVYLDAHTHI